jgi:hypothetical protein
MPFTPGSNEIYEEALALHAAHKGKLEIRSKEYSDKHGLI